MALGAAPAHDMRNGRHAHFAGHGAAVSTTPQRLDATPRQARRVRMDRTKGHARSHPQAAPISPWLCAVARATRVHRAELSQRGRARRATNHAGSARANTTSGPAPLLSPPGNRRSLLSGAKRRQWKSQNTPPTGTDATCASSASVLHRDSQPRLKSASERATDLVGVL